MPVSRSEMKAPYDALPFLMQVDQEDGERKLAPEQAQPMRGASRFSDAAVQGGSPRLVGRGRACQAIVAIQYARGTAANSAMIWTIVASDRRRFRFAGNCIRSTPPCRADAFSTRVFGHRAIRVGNAAPTGSFNVTGLLSDGRPWLHVVGEWGVRE